MRQKTLDFLEAHQSDQPSTFTEDVKWRQENEVWLKWSRSIALSIVDYMQANGLSRSDIAIDYSHHHAMHGGGFEP